MTSSFFFLLLPLCLVVVSPAKAVFSRSLSTNNSVTLKLPDTLRVNFDLYQDYLVTVSTATTTPNNVYSSFSLQIHSQLYQITLRNASSDCVDSSDVSCRVIGSNVGMVTVWNDDLTEFPFHVRVECGRWNCSSGSEVVPLLLAVVGVDIDDPIPGGCALTSNLVIDPNMVINYTSYSTEVQFQSSDIGFNPHGNQSYPTCDGSPAPYPLQQMEYTVYQRCLGRGQFSVSAMMAAIEDMLTSSIADRQESSYSTLQYNNPKRVQFSSVPGQGVVYNVIATDKSTSHKVAYVPAVTYACNIHTDGCAIEDSVSPLSGVLGVVLMAAGLFLCFIGHNFFHGEVVVLHWIGGSFIGFLAISIATGSLDHNIIVGLSLVIGSLYTVALFVFWFFTAWYWIHVVLFGLYGNFILTASVLYSPLEELSVFSVLQISYVYYLTLCCGMVLFMVPLVAFPRALSVWSSSLVGSYSIIFGIGIFTYTELSEIVLLVVRKLSLSGFYSVHLDCPLLTTDYILMAVWILLLVTGVTVQTTVVQFRRAKHNRRQQTFVQNRHFGRRRRQQQRFNSFPKPSLFHKFFIDRTKHCLAEDEEPLLTPSRLVHNDDNSSSLASNSARLPSDGRWSSSNSGTTYRNNYGAIGATTTPEEPVKIIRN